MESFRGKKRPTINLSIFTNLADSFASLSPNKSPRTFQNGVVGLGIVAAMTDSSNTHEPIFSARSPRSSPIPIVCSAKPVVKFRAGRKLEKENTDQVDELSESYTCVISHFGNNLVKKRVYFDDDDDDDDDDKLENYSVFFASSSPMNIGSEVKTEFFSGDFLSSCFLCQKQLHGLDIFMYRGEKAFCSAECRDYQIRSEADDHKEKCGSEARKQQLDYSPSPCSGPPAIFPGVVVA